MPLNNKTASAKAPVAGTDKIIEELALKADGSANPNGKIFSAEKLTELYNALLNDTNGTLDKVRTLLNTKGTVKAGSGVTTKALNATDFRAPTAGGKDIYVTLGDVKWEVVYLTTNRDNEIILDLWQATNTALSEFSYGGFTIYNDNSHSNVGNVYGTSYMRSITLGNGGTYYQYAASGSSTAGSAKTPMNEELNASAYKKFANGNFSNYLDTPANVDYQEKEGWPELNGATGPNSNYYNLISDAYGYPTIENYYKNKSNNNNNNLTDRASVGGASGAVIASNYKVGYKAWQDDKIWLPSQTETGNSTNSNGIWGLTNNQRANITSSQAQKDLATGTTEVAFTWLRTGGADAADCRYLLPNGTVSADNHATSSAKLAVRPAIHLNLTKADAASVTTLTAPSGTVTADYTGNALTVNNATTVPSWYKHTIYTDPTALTLSYKKDSATVDNITDVGTYTVTVKLSSSCMWSDSTVTDKTFTFTVNKKNLSINWKADSNGYQVAEFADTTEIASRDSGSNYPSLVTKYYDPSGSPNNLKDAPTGIGSWVAVAKIENECNYTIDATKPFTVSKQQIAYPILTNGSASEVYDGTSQEFTFSGYDSDTMTYTAPTGADSFDGTTLKVTNADSYTVNYTLKNTDLYEWSGTAPSAVTITPKSVVISSDSSNQSSWQKKTATDLKFKVPTTLCGSDTSLNLVAAYTLNGGAPVTVPGTIAFDGTNVYTVTIGTNFAKGNYVLTVKVADGENYAGSCTYNFEITAQGLNLDNVDIEWTINSANYTIDDYKDGFIEIEYSGNPLTVSANFDNASDAAELLIDGYGGDWATAIEKGEYTATVHIVAANSALYSFDETFTLNIKIVPKVLTFDDAVWQWQYADDEEWKPLTDKTMPSFDNKAVTVRIDPDYLAGLGLAEGDYELSGYSHDSSLIEQGDKTTTVVITLKNANYTADDTGSSFATLTKDWKITAKALKYGWTATQAVSAGDKGSFELPAIEFEDGKDYSDYFEYCFTVNGVEYTKAEFEEYLAENWTEETPVSGSVTLKVKEQDEVIILPTDYPFNTGTPKIGLTVEISGGGQYKDVEFEFSATRGVSNENNKTKVTIEGETFDGNKVDDIKAFINTLDAGTYTVKVTVTDENYTLSKESYELTIEKFRITQDMWNKKTGKIELPEKYRDGLEITYKYFTDAEGTNEVDISSLGAGDKYFVTATISGDKAANFEFDGGSLEDGIPTLPLTGLEIPKQSSFNIADWWWIFVIIAVVLLVIILAVVIAVVKKRKAAAAGYDDYYDDDYDYDDGDYDGDGDDYDYDGEEYDGDYDSEEYDDE